MVASEMQRRGVWDKERVAGGGVTTRVGVGDRIMRLHNGRAVGTVVKVDAEGPGFTVLLDEPTNRQWDKTGGLLHYLGLRESNLYVGMSAQVSQGGRREHTVEWEALALVDSVATDGYLMAMEIEGERAIWKALGLIEEEV